MKSMGYLPFLPSIVQLAPDLPRTLPRKPLLKDGEGW
jgi:hypothetical protein